MNKLEILRQNGFVIGRMISSSKSAYREANPNSMCVFNANLVTAREGKVWYGDLDLTKDSLALKVVADQIGEIIYVLREHDCRFNDEDKDGTQLIQKAVWDTTQETPRQ